MFKKFLTLLGAITLIFLVLAGVRYVGFKWYGSRADKQSAAYANQSVKAIASSWNAQELVNRAHPNLLAQTNPQNFALLFDKIREIGALKKIASCEGGALISYPSVFKYMIGSGSQTNARYLCRADFARGQAAFVMILHKDVKAGWQILQLNIDSPFFKTLVNKAEKQEPAKTEAK